MAATHKVLIGSVVPRPIAWTSTVSAAGIANLAPFSFFTIVSTQPPMVSLTIEAGDDGREKDTLVNIRDTGEFVVNTVSLPLAEPMRISSGDYPAGCDEFVAAGLSSAPSQVVAPPRVRDALIAMECVLEQIHCPGDSSVVIGRVVLLHFAQGLIDARYHVDVDALQPVGRLGGGYGLHSSLDLPFAP